MGAEAGKIFQTDTLTTCLDTILLDHRMQVRDCTGQSVQ